MKVYDLTERVLPAAAALPASTAGEHLDWACESALLRLGMASAREIASFWQAADLEAVRAWCAASERTGSIVPVRVESADGSRPVSAWALADWQARLRRAPQAPPVIRLLCPFDPVLHDRRRTERLFGFDYRFEAFVPEPQRRYGYYVLAILEGERLVGRVDPSPPRGAGRVNGPRIWWEPGVRATAGRRRGVLDALDRLRSGSDT